MGKRQCFASTATQSPLLEFFSLSFDTTTYCHPRHERFSASVYAHTLQKDDLFRSISVQLVVDLAAIVDGVETMGHQVDDVGRHYVHV